MSICVLLRQGFDKSYNVLMAALALADSSFLSAMFAYGFVSAAGFRYPPKVTTFHFVFFEILRVLDYGGGWTSFTLPLLITSERLLAVFFPMSISRLVSPRKTFVSVLAVAGVLYGMMIYLVVLSSLGYDLTSVSNNASSSPGYIELAVFRNSLDSTAAITSFSTVLFGPFPICYVFTGCVVLSLKIKMASRRRSQLTRGHSKQSGSATRVTGTLLVVCLFYTVCSTFVFLLHSDVIRSLYSGADQGLTEVVLQEVVNVVALLNSSVNFLIYIVMNKNFRATFVSILASLFIRGATAAQRHGPR
ncbi:G-protein coupled receptor daf-37-like [Aplysia californica]|uniref:G-protein coupled receptor daf-37-like n=1 Tax=Aplysia californica TaxID=6500 RepID=A0ABM0JLV8_APLCA|nr:G-protein coupled receptor daf-37-like [Aplysia californica]